jgi:hypothetical protein
VLGKLGGDRDQGCSQSNELRMGVPQSFQLRIAVESPHAPVKADD